MQFCDSFSPLTLGRLPFIIFIWCHNDEEHCFLHALHVVAQAHQTLRSLSPELMLGLLGLVLQNMALG